jgi:hypothetical protein
MNWRAETAQDDRKKARGAKKFFAWGKNFHENMLHNFNNFVQLPTSDIGFRAFHTRARSMRKLIRAAIGNASDR